MTDALIEASGLRRSWDTARRSATRSWSASASTTARGGLLGEAPTLERGRRSCAPRAWTQPAVLGGETGPAPEHQDRIRPPAPRRCPSSGDAIGGMTRRSPRRATPSTGDRSSTAAASSPNVWRGGARPARAGGPSLGDELGRSARRAPRPRPGPAPRRRREPPPAPRGGSRARRPRGRPTRASAFSPSRDREPVERRREEPVGAAASPPTAAASGRPDAADGRHGDDEEQVEEQLAREAERAAEVGQQRA